MPLRNKAGGSTGSLKINSAIEQYTVATGDVAKGDFIELLYDININTALSSGNILNTIVGSYESLSAAAIDDHRVFVAYARNNNKYSELEVEIVYNNSIYSTITASRIDKTSIKSTLVLPLSSTRIVVLSIRNSDKSSYTAYIDIFGVSEDNTISIESLSTTINSARALYGVTLSENRILLAYTTSSNGHASSFTVIPYDISDTSISAVGEGLSIQCSYTPGISMIPIDENDIVLSYSPADNKSGICSAYLTISGTTTSSITTSTTTDISSTVTKNIKSTKLTNNSIAIVGNNDTSLIMTILTISSDNTLNYRSSSVFGGSAYSSGDDIALICLPNNELLVITSNGKSSINISYMIFYVDPSNSLILLNRTDYANSSNAHRLGIVKLTDNLFIYHSLKHQDMVTSGYTMIDCSIIGVKTYAYKDIIVPVLGVAKDSGTTGDIIDIYVRT